MSQELTCKCTCDALQTATTVADKNLEVGVTVFVVVCALGVLIFAGVVIYRMLSDASKKTDDDIGGGYY